MAMVLPGLSANDAAYWSRMAARPSVRSPCSSTTRASSAYVAAAAAASPALNAFVNAATSAAMALEIYGYLMVTRAVDPVALERSRMCQVSTGEVPEPAEPSTASSTSPCRSWPPASPTATPGGCSVTAPATT